MIPRMLLLGLLLILAGCAKPGLPHEGKSVAKLVEMLEDQRPHVQAQAALGLSLHGPEARAAVPQLVSRLGSNDSLVRQQAALALGKIGPDARLAREPLEKLLLDADWQVRRQAALALGGLGDVRARPALERLRSDPSRLVRRAVTDALARLTPEPRK